MLRLTAPVNVQSAEGEKKRRYLRGIAVPWDVEATVMDGTTVKFAKGALPTEGPAPKLIESHDLAQIRGLVTGRTSTDEGMEFEAQIAAPRRPRTRRSRTFPSRKRAGLSRRHSHWRHDLSKRPTSSTRLVPEIGRASCRERV